MPAPPPPSGRGDELGPEERLVLYRERRSELARAEADAAFRDHRHPAQVLSGGISAVICIVLANTFGGGPLANLVGALIGVVSGVLLAPFFLYLLKYLSAPSKVWAADREKIKGLEAEREQVRVEVNRLAKDYENFLRAREEQLQKSVLSVTIPDDAPFTEDPDDCNLANFLRFQVQSDKTRVLSRLGEISIVNRDEQALLIEGLRVCILQQGSEDQELPSVDQQYTATAGKRRLEAQDFTKVDLCHWFTVDDVIPSEQRIERTRLLIISRIGKTFFKIPEHLFQWSD